jgi:glyoxylase-like metal-dependent hydrolase (beta-lactamase superfamily II)
VLSVGLLTIAAFAAGQAPQVPGFPPLGAAEKVAENLYIIPGQGGNSALWVRHDGVLLVDTKVAGNGQGLLDRIRSVTDKPVTHIINTHTHADHVGSNSEFPAMIEVIAQENVKTSMEKMAIFKTAAGVVGLPDRTFKDRLTLFSGKEAVDLYYFGAAHTGGDTLVVFRDARVMHAGDMFATKGIPVVDVNNGGSVRTYGETIAKAVANIRNVDRVIPGHDVMMSWQDFADYGEFNRLVFEHARASQVAGRTPEQARDEFRPPAKFASYNLTPPFGGPTAIYNAAYAELQGDPH